MREPRVLAERFRVKAALAHGGAGELLRVADLWRQGAERALRLQGIPPTEQQTRALEREYRFLSEIDHPLLPRAYDFGRLPDGRAFLTTELIEGKEINRAWPRLSPLDRFALLEPICLALQAIHAHGVLHGHLCAEAILVESAASGGARVVGLDHAAAIGTPGNQLHPAPAYAAPELQTDEPARPASDLYAFGILLHRLFTGRLPFGDAPTAARKHREAPVPDLERTWRSSPPAGLSSAAGIRLGRLIVDLMAKRASDRPPSATRVAQRLREVRRSIGTERRATAARWNPAAAADPRPRFVGRSLARGRLGEAIERVLSARRPDLVVIHGPPGSGKRRLLESMSIPWRLQEGVTVDIPCDQEQTPEIPILNRLIAGLVRTLPPDRAILTATGTEILKLAPSVADDPVFRGHCARSLHWESAGRPLPHHREMIRRWDRVATLLALTAQRAPLWLRFRDADQETETIPALLAAMQRHGGAAPVLICLISESATLPPWLAKPEPLGLQVSQIPLGGLTQESTAELVDALAGLGGLLATSPLDTPAQPTREFARRVHRETDGHPGRIVELIRDRADRDGEHWQPIEEADTEPVTDPLETLRMRLRLLGPDGVHLLHLLAQSFAPLPESVLLGAHRSWARGRKRQPSASGSDCLAALRLTRWAKRSARHSEPAWQLCDPGTGSLLRAICGPADRRRLHAELGAAWEPRLREAPGRKGDAIETREHVARHFLIAGELEKGLRHALPAALAMQSLHAHRRSLGLLESCLPAAKKLAGRTARLRRREVDLLLPMAASAETLGEGDRLATILKRLRSATLRSHLRPLETADVLRQQASLALRNSKRSTATRLLRQANDSLGKGKSRSDEARRAQIEIARTLAELHLRNGAAQKALAQCHAALDGLSAPESLIRDGRLGVEVAQLIDTAGLAQIELDQPSAALQSWARAHRSYLLAEDAGGVADILTRLGKFHLDRGNLRRAGGALSRSIAQRQMMHDLGGVADALNDLGVAVLMGGRLAVARRILETGHQLRQRAGDRRGEIRALANLGGVDLLAGSYGPAEERLAAAFAFADESGDECDARGLRLALASAWLSTGRRAKAEHALRRVRGQGVVASDALAAGLLHLGLGDCALERHRETEARDPFVASARPTARKRRRSAAGQWLRRARQEYATAMAIFRDQPHLFYYALAVARILQVHLAAVAQAAAGGKIEPAVTAAQLTPEEVGGYFQALGRTATDLDSSLLEAWNLLLRGNDRLLTALAAAGQPRGENLSVARSVFRDAHAIAQKCGLREILWQVRLGHARASRLAGHYRRAHNHLRRALDLLREMQREVYGKEQQKQFLRSGGRDLVEREVELLAGAAGLRIL